jgi:hypothetical protein
VLRVIIFGSKKAPVGVEELLVKCPACESHQWADVMVISHYYHFFFIPVFPFDKEADIICSNCGLKRYGRAFDANLVSNYTEIKNQFRHPWYSYTGLLFFSFLVLVLIISSLLHG